MAMTFRLKDFDGPLDLLLHLISKAQINIRDIFISEITDQYIQAVSEAPDLDMEEASDFLVMAATLLEIKSRAMLPKPPEPEDGIDPEEELIRRLEEYKRIRESVDSMKEFEEAAKKLFTKLPDEFPLPPQETELVGLTLQGLTEALKRILARRPEEPADDRKFDPRKIHRDEHTVQGCMLGLLKRIRHCGGQMLFEEAFSECPTREEVVTQFLALLELLKLGEMYAEQSETYGDILLKSGRKPDPEEGEELGEPRGRRAGRKSEGTH